MRLTLTSQGWLAPHTRLIGTSLFYARLYLAHRFKKCAGPNSVPTIHRLQKQPRAEHRSGLRPTKSIDGIVGTTGRRGVSGGAEIPSVRIHVAGGRAVGASSHNSATERKYNRTSKTRSSIRDRQRRKSEQIVGVYRTARAT